MYTPGIYTPFESISYGGKEYIISAWIFISLTLIYYYGEIMFFFETKIFQKLVKNGVFLNYIWKNIEKTV